MIFQSFQNAEGTVRVRIVLTHEEWVQLPSTVRTRLELESRNGVSQSGTRRVVYLR